MSVLPASKVLHHLSVDHVRVCFQLAHFPFELFLSLDLLLIDESLKVVSVLLKLLPDVLIMLF